MLKRYLPLWGMCALVLAACNQTANQPPAEGTQQSSEQLSSAAMSEEAKSASGAEESEIKNQAKMTGVMMKSGKMMTVWDDYELAAMGKDTAMGNMMVMMNGSVKMKDGTMKKLKDGDMMMGDGTLKSLSSSEMRKMQIMETEGSKDNAGMMKKEVSNTGAMEKGSYSDFADNVVGNGRKSVLFFHAAWCPYCAKSDKDLIELYGKTSPPVSTYKVDYDSATELKKKYGIVQQHTFVLIDGTGNALQKLTSTDKKVIEDFIVKAGA